MNREPTNGELAVVCGEIQKDVGEIKEMIGPVPVKLALLSAKVDFLQRLIYGTVTLAVSSGVGWLITHF